MSEKKQKRPATPTKRRKSSGKINIWQSRKREDHSRLIVAMAIIGVLVIIGGYFLQKSGVFSLDGAQISEVSSVQLSEVMSENVSTLVTDAGDVPDWIEIVNVGNEDVDIGRYSLVLESKINRMFTFPEYTLAPGERLLIYAEGMDAVQRTSEWSAPFKLPASGGETLVLMNARGKVIDSVELPELSADESYVRQSDNTWIVSDQPSPGSGTNTAVVESTGVQIVADVLEISEIMSSNTLYFADANGETYDYIEIHNTSSETVNLFGWYLSDSSDRLKRWSFPDVEIQPDGYFTVHCSGKAQTDDPMHLHTDFKLSSSGETVYLTRPDGQTVSMVCMPALETNQAYSLVNGEWTAEIAPTPGYSNDAQCAAQVLGQTFGDRSSELRINEIAASPVDQDYDWIEIYNGSGQAIDLSGYGLSDNAASPRKWQFPSGTTIQPGEYMGIFLSGTEDIQIGGFLNASFALSADGCYTVSLSDAQGNVLDAVYVPKQYTGVTFGRVQGQSGFYYFDAPTPGAANTGNAYFGRADEANVSTTGGLFETGDVVTVELSAPAGSRIYYSLDCSDPDESATLYTAPIQISGTTILRSRVYRDGYLASYIDTQSYLYDVQCEGDVYVVSIVSDMENLMGNNGLLSNYLEDIEQEGHVELFTTDGECVISQGCGLSLHGQDSRKKTIKSFNVIARGIYGNNRFEYPIFSQRDYDSYQSFLLRPSGEDQDMSFMRDTVLSSLMRGSSVLFQEHEVAVMYLDGKYYTLCYVRERMNKHSISQFEGWEGLEDEIDLIKGNSTVTQGSNETFAALLQWAKNNDTTTDEAYAILDSQIDIQNFIEYMALQIYVGNTDTLNVRRYRCEETDGKWRWILFDLDWAFFNDTNSIKNWLTSGGTGAGKRTDNTLFIACMKNPTFREQFLVYFGEQMATTFTTENVVNRFYEQYQRISPMLPQYLSQWGFNLDAGIQKVIRYAEERPTKLLNYFKETFGFSDEEMMKYFSDAAAKIQEYESGKAGN